MFIPTFWNQSHIFLWKSYNAAVLIWLIFNYKIVSCIICDVKFLIRIKFEIYA